MTVTVFSHAACLQHDLGNDHPEAPARLHAIFDQLLSSGLEYVIQHKDCTEATEEQLKLVHDPAYVQWVQAKAPTDKLIWLDDDTAIMSKSIRAARYAAGALINAVDTVMSTGDQQTFCAIRPPGHHAESNQAMGFCIFNNVAVGAAYALSKYQLKRILIVDFDVHHGNGTEQIFRDDPRVLFCSSFEHPLFPYTDPTSSDHILKMPLNGASHGQIFRKQFSEQWLAKIHEFAPELIMISAGFDAHGEDEMAHLKWNEQDYHWIATQLKQIADTHCQGRIVACLEGGYACSALGRSVVAMLKAWV